MDQDSSATAKDYYNTEIGSRSSSRTDSMKIGLMYVNDYGYAAAPSNWTTRLYNYSSATSTNWLYIGYYEWTISRSTNARFAFQVESIGYVIGHIVSDVYVDIYAVRPSFYLESGVSLAGGSGTSSDPYRISLN